jgi:hypothetical protein
MDDQTYGTKDYPILKRSKTTFGEGRYPDRTRTRPLKPWKREALVMLGSEIVGIRAANNNYKVEINYKEKRLVAKKKRKVGNPNESKISVSI